MSVTISPIYLLDVGSNAPVEAELRDAIEEQQLVDWEALWMPSLFEALRRLRDEGVPRDKWPQSRHWNWRDKLQAMAGLASLKTFSIVCGGETQGLMAANLDCATSRLITKAPLAYVEYLESAPWNRPELFGRPRYRGVGMLLIRAAIALSEEEEFKGRIGLHSLPQADRFYREKCGMTDLGEDNGYQNLRYFEMTPEQAQAFVKGEGRK